MEGTAPPADHWFLLEAERPHAVAARVRHAAIAFATGLVLAGCAAAAAPPTPPPAAGPTPSTALDWAGTTCSRLQPIVDQITPPPAIDLADVTSTRQAYLTYLDTTGGLTDQAVHELDAAGPPPVSNGERIAAQLRGQLTQMRTDLDQAHRRLQQADPGNVISLGPAIASATDVIGSIGSSAKALATVKDDPELGPAIAQAPACASLRAMS